MRIVPLRIHRKTLQFLYAFCPDTIQRCLRDIRNRPKSRMVDIELFQKKCECIERIICDSDLCENTGDVVVRDLERMRKAGSACETQGRGRGRGSAAP